MTTDIRGQLTPLLAAEEYEEAEAILANGMCMHALRGGGGKMGADP